MTSDWGTSACTGSIPKASKSAISKETGIIVSLRRQGPLHGAQTQELGLHSTRLTSCRHRHSATKLAIDASSRRGGPNDYESDRMSNGLALPFDTQGKRQNHAPGILFGVANHRGIRLR